MEETGNSERRPQEDSHVQSTTEKWKQHDSGASSRSCVSSVLAAIIWLLGIFDGSLVPLTRSASEGVASNVVLTLSRDLRSLAFDRVISFLLRSLRTPGTVLMVYIISIYCWLKLLPCPLHLRDLV